MNYTKITYMVGREPTRCPNEGCKIVTPDRWGFNESIGNEERTFVCNKGLSHKISTNDVSRPNFENDNGAYGYFSYSEFMKKGDGEKKNYTNMIIGRYDKYTGNYYDVALPDAYATVLSIKLMMEKDLQERSFKRT